MPLATLSKTFDDNKNGRLNKHRNIFDVRATDEEAINSSFFDFILSYRAPEKTLIILLRSSEPPSITPYKNKLTPASSVNNIGQMDMLTVVLTASIKLTRNK
jgi:hypothetical protein